MPVRRQSAGPHAGTVFFDIGRTEMVGVIDIVVVTSESRGIVQEKPRAVDDLAIVGTVDHPPVGPADTTVSKDELIPVARPSARVPGKWW
jgi:hypothetical protein